MVSRLIRNLRMKSLFAALSTGMVFATASWVAAAEEPADPQAGFEHAQTYCATCHAISEEKSPLPQAPRFRTMAARRPRCRSQRSSEHLPRGMMNFGWPYATPPCSNQADPSGSVEPVWRNDRRGLERQCGVGPCRDAAVPYLAKANCIVLLSVAEDDKEDPSLAAMAGYLALIGCAWGSRGSL